MSGVGLGLVLLSGYRLLAGEGSTGLRLAALLSALFALSLGLGVLFTRNLDLERWEKNH